MGTLSGEEFLSLFLKPISDVKEDINKQGNEVKKSVQGPEKKFSNIDKVIINMSEEVSRMNEKTNKETLRVKNVSNMKITVEVSSRCKTKWDVIK